MSEKKDTRYKVALVLNTKLPMSYPLTSEFRKGELCAIIAILFLICLRGFASILLFAIFAADACIYFWKFIKYVKVFAKWEGIKPKSISELLSKTMLMIDVGQFVNDYRDLSGDDKDVRKE